MSGILIGSAGVARAQQCSTVADFNDAMDQQRSVATDVTLTFTVTGVNLDDYFNGKGWLAELVDTRCADGGSAALKVYGTSDPINEAHPPGTVKLEYGSYCCADGACPVERWADPNPGEAIFTQPSQICSIVMHLDPATISYDIECDDGPTYHAQGDNPDGIVVTRAALLEEVSGGHAMDNATLMSEEICYDAPLPPVDDEQSFPVVEDVTVAPFSPDQVYELPEDLACGLSDGWIYLKFDLQGIVGRVTSATLFLHSASDSSAEGTGGDVMHVPDDGWSETTLTWNARPEPAGGALTRIDGVTPDRWYSVDVSAGVRDAAVYSFAVVPGAGDENASHFLSKEASATLGPYLEARIEVVDADGDGAPAGADCDDEDATVHPGAAERCDGVDNDCSGQADEHCPPGETDGGTAPPGFDSGPDAGDAGPVGDDQGDDPGGELGGELGSGCGCSLGGRPTTPDMLVFGAVAAAIAARSTRRVRDPHGKRRLQQEASAHADADADANAGRSVL